MIKIGEIFYLSDQFGPKFIRIKDIDETWIRFYKCPNLNHLNDLKFLSPMELKLIVECGYIKESQMKRVPFERLYNNFTFKNEFKGCIKIPDYIIKNVENYKLINIEKFPYLKLNDEKFKNDIICKKISEQDFRNLQLGRILDF